MNDEEIKAVEILKNMVIQEYDWWINKGDYAESNVKEANDAIKTILDLIERQQKENKKQEKLIEKLLNIKLYACDENKNKECNKKNCYINGGECDATTDITKVKYINLDDYISKNKIRERIKHIPTNEKNEIRKYQCIAMRCILYELLGE